MRSIDSAFKTFKIQSLLKKYDLSILKDGTSNSLACSNTPADFRFVIIIETLTSFLSSKYSNILRALDPDPEAKMAIFFVVSIVSRIYAYAKIYSRQNNQFLMSLILKFFKSYYNYRKSL